MADGKKSFVDNDALKAEVEAHKAKLAKPAEKPAEK
jgi:hypothetical protein